MLERRLLRSEWIKLTSVRRWALGLVAAGLVTVLFSMLVASGSGVDLGGEDVIVGPDGNPVTDDFHFVHQPLTGDGSITAQVLTQTAVDQHSDPTDPQGWAKAGIMIKESTTAGSPYAAVLATPEHGIRMQSNFTDDIAGSEANSPRWLRLVRDGSTITGFESSDSQDWAEIGSVTMDGLPETVEVGMFVASPAEVFYERQAGSTAVGNASTLGIATFGDVTLEPSADQPSAQREWAGDDIGNGFSSEPATEVDQVFTVTGSGDIADNPPSDDVVQISLTGVIIGSLAVVAVCVLFVTSEYRRGMIRTTFVAAPRRGRVLLAKASVAGAVTFAIGLVACAAAFILAQPMLRENGFEPPRFPEPSWSDPSVIRAVVGGAVVLAVLAIFSVGVGTIVRRSAAAVAIAALLFFVPAFVATGLPPTPAEWLMRLTPAGGLAMTRALEPTKELVEPWAMISPWAGLGVLCAYAAVAMLGGAWLLRRRDA